MSEGKGPYTVDHLMGAKGYRLNFPDGKSVVLQDHNIVYAIRNGMNTAHALSAKSEREVVMESALRKALRVLRAMDPSGTDLHEELRKALNP